MHEPNDVKDLSGTIRHTIEIDRPPADVWPWLEEPEKQKQWMKGLLSNEPLEDARGPGSRFRMRIKEGRRESGYEGEVVAREPERRLAVKLEGGCFPKDMAMHVDYRLTDLGGRTRLDYECGAEVPGFWMRLMAGLFKVFGKMQAKSFLRELKRRVESAGTTVAA